MPCIMQSVVYFTFIIMLGHSDFEKTEELELKVKSAIKYLIEKEKQNLMI